MDLPDSTPKESNEEAMIRYLLGEGSEEERTRIQERLLGDEEYFDQMLLVEHDLMDAYVRGELSAAQRDRVASHLFGSRRQREKRDFAEALARHLEHASPARWRRWVAPLAAMLVLASGCGLLLWQNARLRTETAELHARLDRPAPALPGVFSFAVPPGQTRAAGAGTPVTLPANAELARIQLIRESPDKAHSYSVIVRTAKGQECWHQAGLAAFRQGPVTLVQVWVPAPVLAAGEYEAELSGGGEVLDVYYFRIQP